MRAYCLDTGVHSIYCLGLSILDYNRTSSFKVVVERALMKKNIWEIVFLLGLCSNLQGSESLPAAFKAVVLASPKALVDTDLKSGSEYGFALVWYGEDQQTALYVRNEAGQAASVRKALDVEYKQPDILKVYIAELEPAVYGSSTISGSKKLVAGTVGVLIGFAAVMLGKRS